MTEKIPIELTVNRRSYTVMIDENEKLADVLRNKLNLTGTKIGCGEGRCGACTILLNDKPVLSCVYPAKRADQGIIVTIEGLAEKENNAVKLHPLQQAFLEEGAVQCGYCTPGQIMKAYALLQKNTTPTQDEIYKQMKSVLCRCAAYPSIERSIQRAAARMRGDTFDSGFVLQTAANCGSSIGKKQLRLEGIGRVTGDAKYASDIKFDGMLIGKTKRAMIAHGFLKKLDVSYALEMPGVVAVLTAEDIPGAKFHGVIYKDWPVLVGLGEKVRYCGDAVAIVAAENEAAASAAIDAIVAEYKEIAPVLDLHEALKNQGETVQEYGNLLKKIEVSLGDVQLGFDQADVILENRVFTPTMEHAFIETECSIARRLADGKIEIYTGSQIPYEDREQTAHSMHVPLEKVRVYGTHVGGGFGGKEDITGQIHAAMLACATGKPVKIWYDRAESMLVHSKRHATEISIRMGATKDGKITAIETELLGDTGAYASVGEQVMTRATTHATGPYSVPNLISTCYALFTNRAPSGAFRGFGVMQSIFSIETMMDKMAEAIGMDALDFRIKNCLRVGLPTATGQIMKDSVGIKECLEWVRDEMERRRIHNPWMPKQIDDDTITAWGVAGAIKNTGLGSGVKDASTMELEILADGRIEARCAAVDLGQGLATVIRQIIAEELKLRYEQIDVLFPDTDITPDGGATTASRQTYVTGNAAYGAARQLIEKMRHYLAQSRGIDRRIIQYKEGQFCVEGWVWSISQVATEMRLKGLRPMQRFEYVAPDDGSAHVGFSFNAQAVEIAAHLSSGKIDILRVISATDVGRIINPLGLQAQIEGGIMMGIGHALMEEMLYDEQGQLLTDRLSKYKIPTITDTPTKIISHIIEDPLISGPYGAKGVGEIVCIPIIPAITNALYHAVGVRFNQLPVTPERFKAAMKAKNRSS